MITSSVSVAVGPPRPSESTSISSSLRESLSTSLPASPVLLSTSLSIGICISFLISTTTSTCFPTPIAEPVTATTERGLLKHKRSSRYIGMHTVHKKCMLIFTTVEAGFEGSVSATETLTSLFFAMETSSCFLNETLTFFLSLCESLRVTSSRLLTSCVWVRVLGDLWVALQWFAEISLLVL